MLTSSPFTSVKAQKALILTVVTIFWFSQYVYMPYQTPYLYAIGTASQMVGMVVGAYGFSQMLLRIPVGLMADGIGRHKSFILLGTAAAGCASLLRVSFPNPAGFLFASLLSGLASAMWISFMILFYTHFAPEELQKASAWIVGANNLGILLGFITGALVYDRFGIRFLCLLAALAAVAATLLALLIRDTKKNFQGTPFKERVKIFRDRRLILFALIALIQQGVQISTSMSFTTQVAKNLGASGFQIGICSIIYILTAVASSFCVSTGLFQRIKVSVWIPAILACLAAYCIFIPNLPNVVWIDAAQILSGLSTGILFSLCTSEAMKRIPEEKRSSAMGFYQAVYALGMTTFPILVGAISGSFGIRNAFYFLAAVAGVGFLVMVLHYTTAIFDFP